MTTKASANIKKLTGINLTFGKAICAIRLSDEVTQEVFAKKLGVSKQYLSALENNRKLVSVAQAKKFAQLLGQSEKVFVKYALQDLLRKNHIDYYVDLRKAA
jgi:transcriptional regulator with XRE-family HTH domain